MHLLDTQAIRRRSAYHLAWALLCLLVYTAPATGAELAIVETVDMDFGAVLDSNGSVVLGLNDGITSDPAGIHVGNTVFTGQYLITGDPFAAFSLSVTGSSAAGLTVGSFNTSEGLPPLLSVALNGFGELDLRLGATLTVDSGTATSGLNQPLNYTISIDYN